MWQLTASAVLGAVDLISAQLAVVVHGPDKDATDTAFYWSFFFCPTFSAVWLLATTLPKTANAMVYFNFAAFAATWLAYFYASALDRNKYGVFLVAKMIHALVNVIWATVEFGVVGGGGVAWVLVGLAALMTALYSAYVASHIIGPPQTSVWERIKFKRQ